MLVDVFCGHARPLAGRANLTCLFLEGGELFNSPLQVGLQFINVRNSVRLLYYIVVENMYLGEFFGLGKQLVNLLGEVLLRLESSFGHGERYRLRTGDLGISEASILYLAGN